MALTALDVYKKLPKTNCKKCGFPTCMAFAMQVAAKQKALTDCPDLSEDAKSDLADASTPPMKLVKIGTGDKQFTFGQETVMFRHEEKFHHPAAVAARIPASLSDEEAIKMVEKVNGSVFDRVGEKLKIHFCALEIENCPDPAGRVKLAARKSRQPLILMGKEIESMKACVEAVKSERPLIYRADSSNIDAFAGLAAAAKIPLAIEGSSLEELADLTEKARQKGVEEIVMAINHPDPAETLRRLTTARRAALVKNFKPLGYPAMVEIGTDTPATETILAATFASKYAGIVITDAVEPWQLLPVLTSIQDVYTDPQVPNTVDAKLYEVGSVTEDSPLMFTTNFALTYFCVSAEVERSKIPTFIAVVETEGMGVLNAYAGDKISPEKIIKTLKDLKAAERVKHRKLIIPGLLPVFRAELQETSEWEEVIIGPETAREIPAFLNRTWN